MAKKELHVVDPAKDVYTNMLAGALQFLMEQKAIPSFTISFEQWNEMMDSERHSLKITQSPGVMTIELEEFGEAEKHTKAALEAGEKVVINNAEGVLTVPRKTNAPRPN